MILIGSRALALRSSHLLTRAPLDFDFVCSKEEFDLWLKKNKSKIPNAEVYELPEFSKWVVRTPEKYDGKQTICEFEIVKSGSSSELLVDLVEKDSETIKTSMGLIPSLSLLFTLKDSHKFKKFGSDPRGCSNWYKHAIDWHQMKRAGAVIKPEYAEFQKLREAEAYAGQKHPKLNVSKQEFFSELESYNIFQHDDLHIAVAIDGKPAYEQYLADGSPVDTDKEKFFAVSERVRLDGCVQEACVLGLERSLVMNSGWSPDFAFRFAYSKICSSICSGYFRSYAFQYLFEALDLYKKEYSDYYEKFKEALAAGKVRPFSGSKY